MILDVIIIAIIAFAVFRGWSKGAVRILGAFVILIAAILIASAFGTQFGKAIGIGPTLLHPVTGFFILFFILYIIGSFLRKVLTPKSGIFSGLNKILGLMLNVIICVLVLGLIFGFLRIFQMPPAKYSNESKAYPIVLKSSTILVSQLKPLVGQLSNDVYEDISPRDSVKNK
jgi:uncharacterized membrane protein required for colicin V production